MQKRTVAITGGTKGIGAAIAKTFAEHGWNVAIGARQDNGFADSLGNDALFFAMDVVREQDHLDFGRAVVKKFGQLDAYINCAGCSDWRGVQDVDEAFWNRMIDTNLKGVMWGCKAAASLFSDGGCIVNVSSLASKRGSANNSVYCAAKFGVNGITQSLAKELGARGIRVNAVCPVYVQTPGVLEALKNPLSPAGGSASIAEYLQDFANGQSALKRLPTGEEVAESCLFLVSSQSSAITGQCINVDCGVLPQ